MTITINKCISMDKRTTPPGYLLKKIHTNVLGLDDMLFGGLDLTPDHTVIVIKSDEPIQGTLLGLQMLYGVAQSFKKIFKGNNIKVGYSEKSPRFIYSFPDYDDFMNDKTQYAGAQVGNNDNKDYFLNDLLLDTIISFSIMRMTEQYVGKHSDDENSLPKINNNVVSRLFFDLDKRDNSSTEKDDFFYNNVDALICEEAIFYNNRTNALHKRTRSTDMGDVDKILFPRRSNCYKDYLKSDYERERMEFESFLDFPLVDMSFERVKKTTNNDCKLGDVKNHLLTSSNGRQNKPKQSLMAIDLSGCEYQSTTSIDERYDAICDLIDTVRDDTKLLILMVPQSCHIPTERIDMLIELRNVIDADIDYLTRKAHIPYSRRQATVLGWHIYKYRDYGLEFFPSLHTYFQKRRYLQRAMIYTHSSVVSETYQQYLDRKEKEFEDNPCVANVTINHSFEAYLRNRKQEASKTIDLLYEDYSIGQSSVSILETILMPYNGEHNKNDDRIQNVRGSMTAIFGDGNTYKRFITFGSIFSSALNQEHTLIVLLNKDSETSLRRLFCPARCKRGKDCQHCHECYKYIHFMDINTGNITPEEFIYFLKKQIEIKYSDGKRIKRVVIDDLQIVDYCYPYLLKNNLFLSALISICKNNGVYSYILCDRVGKKAGELRAVADNIICTRRDKRGKLQVCIERFIGFHNTPSKIYCGIVDKVKNLFECYYKIDRNGQKQWSYRLNSLDIEDDAVSSMSAFWEK